MVVLTSFDIVERLMMGDKAQKKLGEKSAPVKK